MKIQLKPSLAPLLLLAVWLGAGQLAQAQVSLSLSPAVISNTYPGTITLTIAGLTNGEKVIVQKWLDLNGNGAIDDGEPMIDAFKLTDNDDSSALIGGVTNINVPFDADGTAGRIVTSLNVVAPMILENVVGQQLFRVVSPSGRFSPTTATFMVTNSALPQSVSGTVYGPDGVTPVPGAVVVAQDQQANSPAGATLADSSGHFGLSLPTGSYYMMCAKPNYYVDQSKVPFVVLTNGMAATTSLYLTNGGPNLVAGSVYDAASSNGIGGLMLQLNSGKLFAIAFTDTNGNYAAAVSPAFWTVQPNKQRMVRRAYVLPQAPFQVDATGGSASNANIALPRGNALFYGRLTDNNNTPFPNTEMDAGTSSGNVNTSYDAKGYTDAQGNYAVAVLGDATNYWGCSANSGKNIALANYVLNNFNGITNVPGQTTLENFVALPAIGTISGHVQNNAGAPVIGVGLSANALINGKNYSTLDATTDAYGNYSLAVATGQWYLACFEGGFSDALDTAGYEDPGAPHQVNVPPANALLNLTVYPLGTPFFSQPLRLSPSQFGFWVHGSNSLTYTLQVSTNLDSTNWASLFSFQLTTNSLWITDSYATNAPRFYRVVH